MTGGTSIMVGGKSLNASHEFGNLLTQSQKESGNISECNKYSYGVFDDSIGIDTQIRPNHRKINGVRLPPK
jgi:hypothetical protein